MYRSSSLRSTLNTSYITGVLRLFFGYYTQAPDGGGGDLPPTNPPLPNEK